MKHKNWRVPRRNPTGTSEQQRALAGLIIQSRKEFKEEFGVLVLGLGASAPPASHLVVKLNTETKASRRLHTTGPVCTSRLKSFPTSSPHAHGAGRAATTRSSVARSHPRFLSIRTSARIVPAPSSASKEEETEGRWEQS